jgi:hypothetical protein
MRIFTDSEYAGDKETKISVSGYIIFLLGVTILWELKAQKLVTLSSAEAELFDIRTAATKSQKVLRLIVVAIPGGRQNDNGPSLSLFMFSTGSNTRRFQGFRERRVSNRHTVLTCTSSCFFVIQFVRYY